MIKTIIHLSDIHIRTVTRHQEYRQVFAKVYQDIESYNPDETIIVITGDVAHSKNTISSEFVDMTYSFLEELSLRLPTFVFPGNHDGNLKNTSRLDALSPICKAVANQTGNLHFIKDSRSVDYKNLTFQHFSVFDEKNWEKLKNVDGQTNIGIYHGTVNNTQLDRGIKLKSDVTPELFKDMDMTLLGDIHIQQEFGPNIAYAGSLIQQNFGESIDGHGYLIWDVDSRTYSHKEVNNDYAFVTLDIVKNKPSMTVSAFKKKFADKTNIKLRFKVTNSNTKEVLKIQDTFHSLKNVASIVTQDLTSAEEVIGESDVSFLQELTDVAYQNKLISEYWGKSLNKKQLKELHRINAELNAQLQSGSQGKGIFWKPIHFKWSNTFSYQGDNELDFNSLDDLVGIIGANHSGKSSIFDSLIYTIFGKCPRTSKPANLLNNKSDRFDLELTFQANGITYKIERWASFVNKSYFKEEVKFYKIIDDEKIDLTGEDRRKTDSEIREILGSYEDFLLTTYSSQNSYSQFIDLGGRHRSDIFSRFLGIDIFESLSSIAKEKRKEYRILLNSYPSDMESSVQKIQASQKELIPLKKSLVEQTDLEVDYNDKLVKIAAAMGKLRGQIKDVDVDGLESLESLQIKSKDLGTAIFNYEVDLTDLDVRMVDCQSHIDAIDVDVEGAISDAYTAHLKDLDKLKQSKKKLQTDIKHQQNIIDSIGTYRLTCDICKNTELAKTVEVAVREIDKLTEKLGDIDTKIVVKDRDTIELADKANAASTQLTTHSNLLIQHRGYKDKKSDLLAKKMKSVESLHKVNDSINKWQLWYSDKTAHENLAKLESKSVEYHSKLTDLKKSLQKLRSQIQKHEDAVKSLTDKLNSFRKLKESQELLKLYLQTYDKGAIPRLIVSKIIPKVKMFVNDILSGLENFNIEFEDTEIYIIRDGAKWDLEMCSGMEKFLSSLALRVALHKCSILPKANFLLIDEGFGNLDSENITKLENVFESIKKFFKFVMIISHVDTVKDYLNSQVIVDNTEGYSKVI